MICNDHFTIELSGNSLVSFDHNPSYCFVANIGFIHVAALPYQGKFEETFEDTQGIAQHQIELTIVYTCPW